MKFLSWLIFTCLLLQACQVNETSSSEESNDGAGGILKINVSENIYSIQPNRLRNKSEEFIARQLFEPLIYSGEEGYKINNNLVSSLDSTSNDTLEITIKNDVLFSNGTLADSASLSQWLKTVNEKGLQVDCNSTTLEFIESNRTLIFSELSRIENYLFSVEGDIPVGTGPFELQSINEDIVVQLEKNLKYPGDDPAKVDGIEIRMIKTKDTEIQEFINGSLDLVRLNPLERLQFQNVLSLENHPNYSLSHLNEVSYSFGLLYGMDSLEAYQIGKVLNERPYVYSLTGAPELLRFPNLSKAALTGNFPTISDETAFSQLTLEELVDKGLSLSVYQDESKFIKLVEGRLDKNGLPVYELQADNNLKPDFLVILNSWSGLAVYQYYLKSDNALDNEMIDLKSLYFKAPTKLE